MAQFEWLTRRIDLRDPPNPAWTIADLANVPTDRVLTLTLLHEYVHFLQLVSSVPGLRLLGDLVSFAVKGAVTLAGVPVRDGKIVGYHQILKLLQRQPDGAGRTHPGIQERARKTLDEANALLSPQRIPYKGAKAPWEIDRQEVVLGTYEETMAGIVVPGVGGGLPHFRPLSPGMLSEVMARCIDRWVNENEAYGHRWAASVDEAEHYNGLRQVLSTAPYRETVPDDQADEVAVTISHLALATPRPDEAAALLLTELTRPSWRGHTLPQIAHGCRRLLVQQNLLQADHYNEVMSDLMHGDAQVMSRQEFYEIYAHMKSIHFASNAILEVPDFYADRTVDWTRVHVWMQRRGIPRVVLDDGEASAVCGIQCEDTATSLLLEAQRVLL